MTTVRFTIKTFVELILYLPMNKKKKTNKHKNSNGKHFMLFSFVQNTVSVCMRLVFQLLIIPKFEATVFNQIRSKLLCIYIYYIYSNVVHKHEYSNVIAMSHTHTFYFEIVYLQTIKRHLTSATTFSHLVF